MYLIEYVDRNGKNHQIATSYGSVFMMCWILNESKEVLQFKVSQGSYLTNKDFGYGEMKKWVVKYNYWENE